MKIKLEMNVEVPKPPNFLRYGDDGQHVIDIADVSQETLLHVAELWTSALIENAKRRKVAGLAKDGGK